MIYLTLEEPSDVSKSQYRHISFWNFNFNACRYLSCYAHLVICSRESFLLEKKSFCAISLIRKNDSFSKVNIHSGALSRFEHWQLYFLRSVYIFCLFSYHESISSDLSDVMYTFLVKKSGKIKQNIFIEISNWLIGMYSLS